VLSNNLERKLEGVYYTNRMFTIKIQIPCTVLFHIGNVCSPIFFSGAKSGQVPITIKIHTTMLTEEQKEQEILQAFKAFDRDGNGTISRDELAHVYQHLTNRLPTEHVKLSSQMSNTRNTIHTHTCIVVKQ
jgi:hypothetical protein